MQKINKNLLAKVPEVTLIFWIIKIAATTLGETAGDFVSMSLETGYLLGTAIFAAFFFLFVFLQIRASKFSPVLYWLTIIATTTVGTTLADFADRSMGIGYLGGSLLLLILLLGSLGIWYTWLGSISIDTVVTPKEEIFYWLTIMFSQTLGTALGDWTAASAGLGYGDAALIFSSVLAFLALIYFFTNISRTLLFWSAFIFTRPLGAVVGDYLDKPIEEGGLNLSRYTASLLLVLFITLCIFFFPQKPAQKSH